MWTYRTINRTATVETLFLMTCGTEAAIPAEVGEPSFRTTHFDPLTNDQGLSLNLDLIEIKRDKAQLRMMANQQAAAWSYNQ